MPCFGYVEGRNIVIEARFAHGHLDRVPELVAELLGLNVDVIVSPGAVGAEAARKANTKIPLCFLGRQTKYPTLGSTFPDVAVGRRRSGSVAAEVFGPVLGLADQKLIRELAVNHLSRAGN
jgi:hypothetical protein